MANPSKSIAFCISSAGLSGLGQRKYKIKQSQVFTEPTEQIPRDFHQFEQLEALVSSLSIVRDIMAVLAVLDWTLLVTTLLPMY